MYPVGTVKGAVKEAVRDVDVTRVNNRLEGWRDRTVKLDALVPTCPLTVIDIVPVVAPDGTVAVILVAVGVPVTVATVPLNLTVLLAAVVLKFVPVMVTVVPDAPDVGVNEVMVGRTTVVI